MSSMYLNFIIYSILKNKNKKLNSLFENYTTVYKIMDFYSTILSIYQVIGINIFSIIYEKNIKYNLKKYLLIKRKKIKAICIFQNE